MAKRYKMTGKDGTEIRIEIRDEETFKAVSNSFAEAMKKIGPGIVAKAKSKVRLGGGTKRTATGQFSSDTISQYIRSIRWKVSKRGSNITGKIAAFLIAGDSTGPSKPSGQALAAHLEYGTRNNPPKPHIWPAYDEGMGDLENELQSAFKGER